MAEVAWRTVVRPPVHVVVVCPVGVAGSLVVAGLWNGTPWRALAYLEVEQRANETTTSLPENS